MLSEDEERGLCPHRPWPCWRALGSGSWLVLGTAAGRIMVRPLVASWYGRYAGRYGRSGGRTVCPRWEVRPAWGMRCRRYEVWRMGRVGHTPAMGREMGVWSAWGTHHHSVSWVGSGREHDGRAYLRQRGIVWDMGHAFSYPKQELFGRTAVYPLGIPRVYRGTPTAWGTVRRNLGEWGSLCRITKRAGYGVA